MSINDTNSKGEGVVGSRLYPLLFKTNTTGKFRDICSRISSDSTKDSPKLVSGLSHGVVPPACPICRKDLLRKIFGIDDDSKLDNHKAQVLTKVLMYPIYYCDQAPKNIMNHASMKKHAWEMIGCWRDLDLSVLFGEFLDAQHAAFQHAKRYLISSSDRCQVSVNLKSFKNADKTVKYVMANTFRLQHGHAVFGCIDVGDKANDEQTTMTNQLKSIVACIKCTGVAEKVKGFVINSSSCLTLCKHVEDADPSTVAFPCQLYGLTNLLKSIIQKDIRLQETLQECMRLLDIARTRGYCSSDTLKRIDSWVNVIRREDCGVRQTLRLCPYLLIVDKLSSRLRGLQADSSDMGMGMSHVEADQDGTWEQISKYSKLLEPFVFILTSLETSLPTLGQIHLIWSCLTRHVSVWCELLSKCDETMPYSTQCTSQRTIENQVAQFKKSYYHPSFTLGYVLDCRLWTISHGTARPNTASLSIHEISSAKDLASSLARTQDAATELKRLVDFGIPAYYVEDVRNVAGDVYCGCMISSDSDQDEIQGVLSVWKNVSDQLPHLSSIAQSLLMMRGACEKSPSIPSVTRWLVKSRDDSLSSETAKKMAELALHHRLEDRETSKERKEPKYEFISRYFGVDSQETCTMMHHMRRRQAPAEALNTAGYKTPPRAQLLSRAPQASNSLVSPNQDGLSPGLLQLTDQRLQSDWNFGETLAADDLCPSIIQAKDAIREDQQKESKSKPETARHVVQKRLVDHFPQHKRPSSRGTSTPATAPLGPVLESPGNSSRKKQRKALHPRSVI